MFGNLAAFGECIFFFAVPDSLGLFASQENEPLEFLFLNAS